MLGYTPRVYTTMALHMSRPHKNPKTGVYYFRQKTPADLRAMFGKSEVVKSLNTKEPDLARQRHAVEAARQSSIWQSLRAAVATATTIKALYESDAAADYLA